MNKRDTEYWLDQLDRFGLLFFGIFLGGLIENMGIENLSTIIATALLLVTGVIAVLIKKSQKQPKKSEGKK